jgi:hypothetical protein
VLWSDPLGHKQTEPYQRGHHADGGTGAPLFDLRQVGAQVDTPKEIVRVSTCSVL